MKDRGGKVRRSVSVGLRGLKGEFRVIFGEIVMMVFVRGGIGNGVPVKGMGNKSPSCRRCQQLQT